MLPQSVTNGDLKRSAAGNASSACPTWSVPTARGWLTAYPTRSSHTRRTRRRCTRGFSAERPANRHVSFGELRWVSILNWRCAHIFHDSCEVQGEVDRFLVFG